MTNSVTLAEPQILSARLDYPTLCRIFLKQAEGVDQRLATELHVRRQGVAMDSEAGLAIGQVVVEHERYTMTALKLSTRQWGWEVVAKVTPASIRRVAEQSIGDLHEVHADARAKLMLHFMPVGEIVGYFPPSLVTPEAAGYMRGKRRAGLATVIEGALTGAPDKLVEGVRQVGRSPF